MLNNNRWIFTLNHTFIGLIYIIIRNYQHLVIKHQIGPDVALKLAFPHSKLNSTCAMAVSYFRNNTIFVLISFPSKLNLIKPICKSLSFEKSTSHSILIPSYVRWPLVTTIVVYSLLYIWIYFIFILLVSWFNDLQIESNEGRITLRVQKTITNGFKIFLISEVMIFFSLIWSFIHLGLVPNIFILMNFPP
jgi:hypothetical protein